MHKKKLWHLTGFTSTILCIMLLGVAGFGLTTAHAYVEGGMQDTEVNPTQMYPDPATQTITLTYDLYANLDGEWYVQVNKRSDPDHSPPLGTSAKKILTSERKNGRVTGSWTLQLWNIFGANKPVIQGDYEFRFYGPTGGMKAINEIMDELVVEQDQWRHSDSFFSIVPYGNAKISGPGTIAPGDKITVKWTNASKNNLAWIGLFKKGAGNNDFLQKININIGSIGANGTGQWTVDKWLTPGEYEFRIFTDSGYTSNGKLSLTSHYKSPVIKVQPEQGRVGDTLVISWTNGPNYIGYGDSNRVDLYQGDKLYTNLQTGIWPEGTINYKIRSNMPPGMYQVRMISGTDESLMGAVNMGVQAAPASTTGTGTTTSSSTSATGASTTTQTTSTGSSGASSTTTTTSTGSSTASTSATTIILSSGQPTMTVNGVSREIVPGQDAESMMINGRLYAPIQPIAEAMGGKVEWDSREKKMTITMAGCDNAAQGVRSADDASQNASTPAGQNSILGLWKVTEGSETNHHIYMYQEGGKIAGMWDDRMIITGSMNGNVFKGEYHGTVNPNGSAITITLADDGLSFEGMYHFSIKDRPMRGIKNVDATAKIKATPASGASDSDFNGTWGTTAGNIIITQEGTKVRGTWEDKTITGKVEGNVLNGRYYSTKYPEMIWDFNMTMKPDGKNCVLFHTRQGGVLINTWRK